MIFREPMARLNKKCCISVTSYLIHVFTYIFMHEASFYTIFVIHFMISASNDDCKESCKESLRQVNTRGAIGGIAVRSELKTKETFALQLSIVYLNNYLKLPAKIDHLCLSNIVDQTGSYSLKFYCCRLSLCEALVCLFTLIS